MNTKPEHATDTSARSTSPSNADKLGKRRVGEKKPVQLRVKPFQKRENVLHDDVAIACRPFAFRPQKRVLPFLRVARKMGLTRNSVLNDALVFYFDAFAEDSRLRDEARLAVLLKEEQRLIRLNRVMLRSGAYLDLYADKVLRGGGAREAARLGRRPLGALAPEEEPVFRRMIARREAVVEEIREILDRRLPEDEYVLKDERSVSRLRGRCRETEYRLPDGSKAVVRRYESSSSRRRDRHKSVNNVRKDKGDG